MQRPLRLVPWTEPTNIECQEEEENSSSLPGSGPIRVLFVAEGEQAMAFKLGSLNLNAVAQVHTIPRFHKTNVVAKALDVRMA